MHHVALDRARPHDRHLDHEIIKFFRAQARQHGHLRAAFDLEHAQPGTQVEIVWGESPNSRKPQVEPHRQITIRGTVAPCPYFDFARTNYRSEYVEAFLGNGEKYGVSLAFSKESKPLGTCGPVLLLKDRLQEPFLLMNGDILTMLKFRHLYDFALATDAELVVVTRHVVAPFNFGKVITEGDYILDVEEKPNFQVEILAGIYVLKPSVFDLIPPDTYYGIDSLIKDMLAQKKRVARYLMHDYWLDIGQIHDYQVAHDAYDEHFKHLKTGP